MPTFATVDNTLIRQFSDRVHHEAQQMKSRLRPYVEIKKIKGDDYAYDGMGTIEAREITGRVQPVVFDELEHKRRKLGRKRFALTIPVDSSDVRGQLLDPQSNYAGEIVKAMERQFDRVVYEAMFADVLTGRDFDTTVTFANDGGLTVDATAGLTYEKLLEIHQNFIDNEVGNDMNEKIVMAISGDEHTALMSEIELISGDYTRDYVVENGQIQRALGIHLIKFGAGTASPILSVAGGVRSCFAMSTRGICVGMSEDIKLKITERDDYIETTQVQVIMEMGAVRTEGVLVQKVTTTD